MEESVVLLVCVSPCDRHYYICNIIIPHSPDGKEIARRKITIKNNLFSENAELETNLHIHIYTYPSKGSCKTYMQQQAM